MRVLVVDVGGNHVKCWHSESSEKRDFKSSPKLSAKAMVREARELVEDWEYDVVALGLPCRVIAGRPINEPPNLGEGWVEFDYGQAFDKPVRIVNDGCLQALGAYDGGRMLFLSLGTSVGSALVNDGILMALELGRLRYTDDEEIGDLLGRESRKKRGQSEWQELVEEIVPPLRDAFHADYVVLGGGNAKELTRLPKQVRRGHNRDVVAGGIRLWHDYPDPADQPRPSPRTFG